MIHCKLQHDKNTHYGVSMNCEENHLLLQIGDNTNQIRVLLNLREVESLISKLEFYKLNGFKNE